VWYLLVLLPEITDANLVSVRNNHLRETMILVHIVHEDLGNGRCIEGVLDRNKLPKLGEFVYHNQNGVELVGFRKAFDKI
jgi:hypothetical protein